MKRTVQKWLLTAAIITLAGAVLFVGALAAVGFDFTGLATRKFETNMYELHEDFDNILVNAQTATLTFVPSKDGICKVECVEEEKLKHSVKIQEGALMIDVCDSREWYDHIGISFRTPTITVYLPKEVYTSLFVTTMTGDIVIPAGYSFDSVAVLGTTSNISCHASASKSIALETTTGKITMGHSESESVRLTATTGNITASDVSCNTFTAKGTTAEITLQNVLVNDRLCVENTTGDVRFVHCDAGSMRVKTSTGDVEGTLLSEKTFITDTETGKIRVPKSTSGGGCEITTSTGDIEISIDEH